MLQQQDRFVARNYVVQTYSFSLCCYIGCIFYYKIAWWRLYLLIWINKMISTRYVRILCKEFHTYVPCEYPKQCVPSEPVSIWCFRLFATSSMIGHALPCDECTLLERVSWLRPPLYPGFLLLWLPLISEGAVSPWLGHQLCAKFSSVPTQCFRVVSDHCVCTFDVPFHL